MSLMCLVFCYLAGLVIVTIRSAGAQFLFALNVCVGYCSGPIYKLVTTELGGERRFAASVARRLQSLGALTKGDRRAATGADLSMFNYDTVYGRTALRFMYQHICKVRIIIIYK